MVNGGPIGRTIRQKSAGFLLDGWGGRRWKKRHSGSEAEKAEDPGRLVGKGIEDRGNGFRAGDSQQADGHIPESGHDMGSVSGSSRTGVFPEDGVPDTVEPIFDLPVAPDKVQELTRGGLTGRQAGHPQGRFLAGSVAFLENHNQLPGLEPTSRGKNAVFSEIRRFFTKVGLGLHPLPLLALVFETDRKGGEKPCQSPGIEDAGPVMDAGSGTEEERLGREALQREDPDGREGGRQGSEVGMGHQENAGRKPDGANQGEDALSIVEEGGKNPAGSLHHHPMAGLRRGAQTSRQSLAVKRAAFETGGRHGVEGLPEGFQFPDGRGIGSRRQVPEDVPILRGVGQRPDPRLGHLHVQKVRLVPMGADQGLHDPGLAHLGVGGQNEKKGAGRRLRRKEGHGRPRSPAPAQNR